MRLLPMLLLVRRGHNREAEGGARQHRLQRRQSLSSALQAAAAGARQFQHNSAVCVLRRPLDDVQLLAPKVVPAH